MSDIDTFYSYLKQSIAKHPLHSHQVRWLFLRVLADYFSQQVDENTVAFMAREMHWYHLGPAMIEVIEFDRELDRVLTLATEFDTEASLDPKEYNYTRDQLKTFYENHKKILKALPDTCCV